MLNDSSQRDFSQAVCDLATELSAHMLARFCDLLNKFETPIFDATTSHRVLDVSTQPQTRQKLAGFLERWRLQASHLSPQSVAWSLRCAQQMHERSAASSVDLVWTGAQKMDFRRSDAALLQVIESSQRDLWIVTFAAYRVEALVVALRAAEARGVTIRFVAESSEQNAQMKFNTMENFLETLPFAMRCYVWPHEKRPANEKGQHGSLHAKCAVADASVALVSSANFTAHALALNMEMGVLIQGGKLPAQIDTHLHDLVNSGEWIEISV